MEYFSSLPCHMIDIPLNSAVFLLNTYNIGLQTGRRELLSLLRLLHLASSYFITQLMFVKALDVKAAEFYHLLFPYFIES